MAQEITRWYYYKQGFYDNALLTKPKFLYSSTAHWTDHGNDNLSNLLLLNSACLIISLWFDVLSSCPGYAGPMVGKIHLPYHKVPESNILEAAFFLSKKCLITIYNVDSQMHIPKIHGARWPSVSLYAVSTVYYWYLLYPGVLINSLVL